MTYVTWRTFRNLRVSSAKAVNGMDALFRNGTRSFVLKLNPPCQNDLLHLPLLV